MRVEAIRKRSFWSLVLYFVVAILLFFWLPGLDKDCSQIPQAHKRELTSGFTHQYGKHFVYYFYYEGLFPVASRIDSSYTRKDFNEKQASNNLEQHGEYLVNEWNHWSRLGENLRVFCYLPHAIIEGTARKPSIIPFNILFLHLSLQLIWLGFWMSKKPILGILTVLFTGSSPFFLFETYCNENIFALLGLTALLLLAFHLPFFKKHVQWKKAYLWVPLGSGVLLGSLVHIRGEILPLLASPFLIYFFSSALRWKYSIVLGGLLLLSFFLANKGWQEYFDAKWEEAITVVEEKGGNPYTGPRIPGHRLWHPIFCGLGDFNEKYGYEWDDQVAYEYAIPVLREKYDMNLKWSGKNWLDQYYDEDRWYYVKFDDLPEYEEVIKNKVLHDIKADPWWYGKIILKRLGSFFSNTSPLHIRIFGNQIPIPFWGWLVLPVLGIAIWRKDQWTLKFLLFTFPAATSSIIIFSGGNSTYNSVYHLLLSAWIFAWGINWIVIKKGWVNGLEKRGFLNRSSNS